MLRPLFITFHITISPLDLKIYISIFGPPAHINRKVFVSMEPSPQDVQPQHNGMLECS